MKLRVVLLCLVVCLSLSVVAFAHPGKTDSSGGHYNHSTGQYHYHHGYSAHQHSDLDSDGDLDCPYNFVDKTDSSAGTDKSSNGTSTEDFWSLVEKHRQELEEPKDGVLAELEKLEKKEEAFWEKYHAEKAAKATEETIAPTEVSEKDKNASKIKDYFLPIIFCFALFGVVLLVDKLK